MNFTRLYRQMLVGVSTLWRPAKKIPEYPPPPQPLLAKGRNRLRPPNNIDPHPRLEQTTRQPQPNRPAAINQYPPKTTTARFPYLLGVSIVTILVTHA
jgi:hypothetical protein